MITDREKYLMMEAVENFRRREDHAVSHNEINEWLDRRLISSSPNNGEHPSNEADKYAREQKDKFNAFFKKPGHP